MNIYIPKKAKESVQGGGWTFTANFIKGVKGKAEITNDILKADIYFIPGSTLVEKEEVESVKLLGKKIVLRLDNIPRNSRNRNTGTSRLLKYSELADSIIYQSQWAKNFLMPFTKKDGEVILNGVDTELFNDYGRKIEKNGEPQCLYIRSSRDETKRWEKAWYNFQTLYFKNKNAHLWIVGKFGPDNIEYKFDLFGGAENRYKFFGVIADREQMAKIYRSVDLLLCPFSNEACSNTVAEALACGTNISFEDDSGGIVEQVKEGVIDLEKMVDKYLKVFEKLL
jgi:glycosyltransferase involved in cell wall biosynthesis